MAKPGRMRVDVNVSEAIMAVVWHSPMQIGAAWLILLEHYDRDLPFEHWDPPVSHRRLLGCTTAAWKKNREAILRCFERLREATEVATVYARQGINSAVRRLVYDRDGGMCRYCGVEVEFSAFHCDHVEPVSKGGSDDLDNLACACRPCNLAKAAKTVDEWTGCR